MSLVTKLFSAPTTGSRWARMALLIAAPVILIGLTVQVPAQNNGSGAPPAGDATKEPADSKPADASAGPTTKLEKIELSTRLEESTFAMREHLKKMWEVATQFNLSESPIESKKLRQQWLDMLDKGHQLHRKLLDAAAEDFKEDPNTESIPAYVLIDTIVRNSHADRYDGMLPLLRLLKDHDLKSPAFEMAYGLTAAAENEYVEARPHLIEAAKQIEKSMQEAIDDKKLTPKQKEEIGKELFELFSLLNEQADVAKNGALWAAEMKAREEDAAGEPLPLVSIVTTKGTIEVELFENNAPNTVANFISLCEKGFYDNLPFIE